jgi:hypothetical protein
MSENENTTTATTPVPAPSPATPATPTPAPAVSEADAKAAKAAAFAALPEEFRDAITDLNKEIDALNVKVDKVKVTEAKDPKLIKAEVFEQNPGNNKKIARILTEYRKLEAQMETLRMSAYKVIDDDGLMPKELSEKEIESLKADVTKETKDLKEKVNALIKIEDMMPILKGKVSMHLTEIKTRRGAAKVGSSTPGTSGTKRPRFKKIEINGVTEDDKGNTVWQKVGGKEEPSYTLGFAALYLKKQHKGLKVSSSELQDLYYAGEDENNLPEVKEFKLPYTFKNGNGTEETVFYTFKCYR